MHDTRQAERGPASLGGRAVQGPGRSKRRLAGLLDEDERARLSLAMLDDVLEALLGVAGSSGCCC